MKKKINKKLFYINIKFQIYKVYLDKIYFKKKIFLKNN